MGIDIDFTGASDDNVGEYSVFEIASTLCAVSSPEIKQTQAGADYLQFSVVVAEGELDGRFAGVDKLFFHTPKAKERAMWVLRRLGVDVDRGKFTLEPGDLVGRLVRVTTEIERSCPEKGCFGGVTVATKDADGNPIWACKKCEWRGLKPYEQMKPAYTGYELVDQKDPVVAKAAAAEKSAGVAAADIPF